MKSGFFQGTLDQIMPPAGLCRANGSRTFLPAFCCLQTRHNHNASPDWQVSQTTRACMTTPRLEGGPPGSLLEDHIEPFQHHLRAGGYAEHTLRKKRTVAKTFARWTRRKQIAGNDLNDGHIFTFASRSPRNIRSSWEI
jgi:hypothetical protein